MKKILLTGMMVCLTASMALASGLNINWVTNATGNCSAVATSNMTWDCTVDNPDGANNGDKLFVVSAMPNIPLIGFNAFDCILDIQSDAALPQWWQSYYAGTCRQTGFVVGTPPMTPTAPCAGSSTTKLWSVGTPFGGVASWFINPSNRARVKIGFATAATRALPLVTTTQYNMFNMHVYTTNSLDVVADPDNGIEAVVACPGCAVPVTLVVQQVGFNGMNGPTPTQDTVMLPGTFAGAQQSINWQGGGGPPIPVPTRNTTWGQVKSLYR